MTVFLARVSSALIVVLFCFVPVVTRSKAVDLQKKQTSRSVFQCYVFGPPGVGKVRLLQTLNQVECQYECVVKCREPIRIRMKSAGKLGARVGKHASSQEHGKTCNIYGKNWQKARERF